MWRRMTRSPHPSSGLSKTSRSDVWRLTAAAAVNIEWRVTGGGAGKYSDRRLPPLPALRGWSWARGPLGMSAGGGRRCQP